MFRLLNRSISKLFVRSLPKNTTPKEIEELAKKFGEVTSVDVPIRDDNLIRGFAYIVYKEDSDGKRASESLNAFNFKGSVLQVSLIRTDVKNQENLLNTREAFKPRKSYDDSPLLELQTFYT